MRTTWTILSIGILAIHISFAQTTQLPTAEVDLAGRVFINNGLPFDERFNITGKIGPNIQKVILKYKPKDANKVKEYFVKDLSAEITLPPWEKLDGEPTFIMGPVGPLRSSTPYIFTFTTYIKTSFSDDQKDALKRKITEKLIEYLEKTENLDEGKIKQLYNELNGLPKQITGKNITNINGQSIDIKPFEEPLKPFSNEIIKLHNTLLGDKQNSANEITTVQSRISSLSTTISDIINNRIVLSDDTKNTLELGVDASISEIGKIKVKDGLKILNELISNPALVESLLKGTSKISSSAVVVPSNVHDNASLSFLSSLLSIITSDNFTKKVDNSLQPIIPNNSDLDKDTRQTAKSLLDINTYKSNITKYTQKLENYKQFIPNFLENVYTSSSFEIVASSEIDVTTEKTPYISVDVGVTGMSNPYQINGTAIGNNWYFFTHQAANIYFVPVNKKAPLSQFKCRYRFWKGFNFHIGIAQLIGNFNSNLLSGSLTEKTSLMFGGGYRFNRVTKLALSCILINQKNINPTIDRIQLSNSKKVLVYIKICFYGVFLPYE